MSKYPPKLRPTDQRKKDDHNAVIKAIADNAFAQYIDSMNPFDPGTLRFERFKRKYLRELPRALDFIERYKELCAVYGTEIYGLGENP